MMPCWEKSNAWITGILQGGICPQKVRSGLSPACSCWTALQEGFIFKSILKEKALGSIWGINPFSRSAWAIEILGRPQQWAAAAGVSASSSVSTSPGSCPALLPSFKSHEWEGWGDLGLTKTQAGTSWHLLVCVQRTTPLQGTAGFLCLTQAEPGKPITEELGRVLPNLTLLPTFLSSAGFVLSGLKLSFHLGWGAPSQSQTFPVGSVSQVLT